MYTNKLNPPIKTSGHGISYILLHIGISSTFVCLNLSHSPLIFFKIQIHGVVEHSHVWCVSTQTLSEEIERMVLPSLHIL